jgi:hypothetical protein
MYYKYQNMNTDLPGSGTGDVGLSGMRIPFCTSSSLLARTDIFRSRAEKEKGYFTAS